MQTKIEYDLLIAAPAEEGGDGIDIRYKTFHGKARGHAHHMLFGNALHEPPVWHVMLHVFKNSGGQI